MKFHAIAFKANMTAPTRTLVFESIDKNACYEKLNKYLAALYSPQAAPVNVMEVVEVEEVIVDRSTTH